MTTAPKEIHLKDYTPPPFLISDIHITFDIFDDETIVSSRLSVKRNPKGERAAALELLGEKIELRSLHLNAKKLSSTDYSLQEGKLYIQKVPDEFELQVITGVKPQDNKSGLGLYQSRGMFCTQMEAEGFRRVTYFPDRPDVMSRYVTTIRADKKSCPVLLSNGDLIQANDLENGRHEAIFRDPFPKPCYLFALVAGKFGFIENSFTTKSGRKVMLRIYASPGDESRCQHAMESLIRSMKWDEEVYGLEYDLNTFSIVAVDDFNFGGMENKGLNIFNSSYVLADPESAGDEDYFNIERVVAHEYFHNWTGDRVTLRDWFQLTLKEGLTVLRDQDYIGDTYSRAVERIRNAKTVRERQFPEDAGPNAHPIQPASYIEIDNFYTTTVYRKGAEVIGMLKLLIGEKAFNQGVREYLRRFDGQAATTEDFISVMAEVGKRDLSQFKLWYSQAGTPKIQVTGNYDSGRKRYELNFTQSCAPTPGQAEKRPFLIPIAIGLLGSRGESIQLPNAKSKSSTVVVELDVPKKSVVFENIDQQPVPSLLRNFSAPVALDFEYSDENLKFLLSHDSDPYCRFEAGQRLALRTLKKRVEQLLKGEKQSPVTELADAYIALLQDEKADPAFRALALPAPSLQTLCDAFDPPDFDAALAARRSVVREIAVHAAEPLRKQYEKLKAELGNEYQRDGLSMGKRALKNMCLSYLIAGESSEALQLASAQYKTATNMTDSYAAYQALLQTETKEKEAAIASFYERWKNDAIVLDMWFVSQISVPHTDALAVMLKLEKDPAVDLHNPNKLEAIYGSFSRNLAQFHRPSGEGYRVFVDRILTIDAYNPNVSARFANAFHWFRRLDPKRKILVRNELKRMLAAPNLSKGLYEIVQRTLDAE